MTKVAIVTYSISHFEVPLYRLMNSIAGLQVRVFHLVPSNRQGVHSTYRCTVDWGFNITTGFDHQWVSSFGDLLLEVGRYAPDVVLVYGYSWPGALSFILRCRHRGIPLIHRGTLNTHRDPRWPLRSRLRPLVQRPLLRLFDAHHYGGSYSKEVLRRSGIDESRMFFVPYSVDTRYFAERADDAQTLQQAYDLRRRLGWEGAQVLLFAAQHSWVKGPDIALEVFARVQARLPEARLLMCGSGAMTSALATQAIILNIIEEIEVPRERRPSLQALGDLYSERMTHQGRDNEGTPTIDSDALSEALKMATDMETYGDVFWLYPPPWPPEEWPDLRCELRWTFRRNHERFRLFVEALTAASFIRKISSKFIRWEAVNRGWHGDVLLANFC